MSNAQSSEWVRLAPLAGIVYLALFIVGVGLSFNTSFLPAGPEILEFYEDNSSRVMTSGYLFSVSAFFLMVFVGSVWASLRDAEGGSSVFSIVALGGGISGSTLAVTQGALMLITGERAGAEVGLAPNSAALYDISAALLGNAYPITLAALIGGFGVVSAMTKAYPRWLTWSSLVLAVGLLSPVNWVLFFLAYVWIAVVSVLLYRRARS